MANSQHEPTMEEILASIRKIIAEDPPGEGATSASLTHTDEAEVLDLTEVHEESAAAEDVSESAAHDQSAAPSQESEGGNGAVHSGEGLFSEKTRKALSDAFAQLEPESSETTNEQVPSMSGLPVEAAFERAVRETFDPVLRKWLDDNAATLIDGMKLVISAWLDRHFPAMLEDAVRNEVARAVMARSRR